MTQITNTTGQSFTIPTKDGKSVDIRPGETKTVDSDHPMVEAFAHVGAFTAGKKASAKASEGDVRTRETGKT